MAGIHKHLEGGINEINITPFVDIVLVLLIIFMISTPALVYQGIRLTLPTVANSEDISHITLKFSIAKDGTYYLSDQPISIDGLKQAITSIQAKKIYQDALISADSEVRHGKVMELADLLKSNGIKHIGFSTQMAPPNKKGQGKRGH